MILLYGKVYATTVVPLVFTYNSNLQIRQGEAKVFIHISEPDETDIGDEESAEIALITGQIPHSFLRGDDVLQREHLKLLLTHYCSPQLEFSVHL